MPGFTAPEMHGKLSLRASVTSELVLRDVRVPEANRFPEVVEPARAALVPERGALRDRLGRRRRRARVLRGGARLLRRSGLVFGKPIAGYQLTQQKLAEMALEINRGTLVALHLGRMKDAGTLRPEHVSMGKMGNVRGALEVCRSARTILGAQRRSRSSTR